jgi:hypothetical protein
VYDRTDLDLDAGFLFKPAEGTAEGDPWTLAPLLIREVRPEEEVDAAGPPSGTAVVYYAPSTVGIGGSEYSQWSYLWSDPAYPNTQGIRITVGADGFPAIYEILRDSSGARLIFVAAAVEMRAGEAYGAAMPGRRFAVERSVEQAPDVVVGGVLESGPIPLGPFVYLWGESGNVDTVICRCMPSRVISIPSTTTYDLAPLEPGSAPDAIRRLWNPGPSSPADMLRLAAGVIEGG